MKEIKAFEATDGTTFFNEDECREYERDTTFRDWYKRNTFSGTSQPSWVDVLAWLKNNAEDIRGFLPPVEEKPELAIEVLMQYERVDSDGYVGVSVRNVNRWLAGELK
jgi:hypothetical protein